MFQVNDIVKCTSDVHFTDNTYHKKGEMYTVTKNTVCYFNNENNYLNYRLWHRGVKERS